MPRLSAGGDDDGGHDTSMRPVVGWGWWSRRSRCSNCHGSHDAAATGGPMQTSGRLQPMLHTAKEVARYDSLFVVHRRDDGQGTGVAILVKNREEEIRERNIR
jgi:hypothetical protein